jgi:polar amino acid transport system substrate-binding protein
MQPVTTSRVTASSVTAKAASNKRIWRDSTLTLDANVAAMLTAEVPAAGDTLIRSGDRIVRQSRIRCRKTTLTRRYRPFAGVHGGEHSTLVMHLMRDTFFAHTWQNFTDTCSELIAIWALFVSTICRNGPHPILCAVGRAHCRLINLGYFPCLRSTLRFCGALWLILATFSFPAIRPADAQESDAAPNCVLIIGTKEAPPFAMRADDGSWTGISIELWRRIADELHLHYRFKDVPLTELVNGTAAGRLDASVAAITVTADRERIIDFSEPYYTTGLGIAIPRETSFNWLRLFGSLISISFVQALLGLVGVTLLIGSLVWVLERRHTDHFSGGVKSGLATGVWWSALTLTQAVPEHGPKTLPGRVIAVAWMAASVTAIAVFTAGITSHLTMKQLEGSVHSVADLQSVRVGAVAGTASLNYLTSERIIFRTYPDAASGLEAVKDGELDAFVYDRPLLYWLAKTKEYQDSIQVLEVAFDMQDYAIALPNNSTLRIPINRTLLAITETQWWRDLNVEYLGTR